MSEHDRIWQPATVVATDADAVVVSFEPLSQCQRCLQGHGCGAGVFNRLFPVRSTRLRVVSNQAFSVGQRVRVGLAPGQLLAGALWLYGLPLLAFLTGAVLGHLVFRQLDYADLAALLVAVGFGATAMLWLRGRPWAALNPTVVPLSCKVSGLGDFDSPGA